MNSERIKRNKNYNLNESYSKKYENKLKTHFQSKLKNHFHIEKYDSQFKSVIIKDKKEEIDWKIIFDKNKLYSKDLTVSYNNLIEEYKKNKKLIPDLKGNIFELSHLIHNDFKINTLDIDQIKKAKNEEKVLKKYKMIIENKLKIKDIITKKRNNNIKVIEEHKNINSPTLISHPRKYSSFILGYKNNMTSQQEKDYNIISCEENLKKKKTKIISLFKKSNLKNLKLNINNDKKQIKNIFSNSFDKKFLHNQGSLKIISNDFDKKNEQIIIKDRKKSQKLNSLSILNNTSNNFVVNINKREKKDELNNIITNDNDNDNILSDKNDKKYLTRYNQTKYESNYNYIFSSIKFMNSIQNIKNITNKIKYQKLKNIFSDCNLTNKSQDEYENFIKLHTNLNSLDKIAISKLSKIQFSL